jgi:hypothetical protein
MKWERENFLPYQGSKRDPSVVEAVASRYTDCANAALTAVHMALYYNITLIVEVIAYDVTFIEVW